jgi:hypothetical protein
MKRYTILLILLFRIGFLMAQQHGISYQAVIIDENEQEIPGEDIGGNYLPDREIAVRFTIYDENGSINYREEHLTKTDEYGMINLMIGWGTPTGEGAGDFKEIDWDGSPKSLTVDISVTAQTADYNELSIDNLVFVPYAFHRNITATGTMKIDGASTLYSSLDVENQSPVNFTGSMNVDGTSDLNNSVNVNNQSATNLSGVLNVTGEADFKNNVKVDGNTDLNNTLNVNNQSPSNLSGPLNVSGSADFQDNINVDGHTDLNSTLNINNESQANFSGIITAEATANFNDKITVNGTSQFNNQVNINVNTKGDQQTKASYPLTVQGGEQGVMIEVQGSRSSSNNFLTFADNNGIHGAIEGQTINELHNSFSYIWYQTHEALNKAFQGAMVAADIVGVDDGDAAAVEGLEMVRAIAHWAEHTIYLENNVGVIYKTGGADYAEWLPKQDPQEQFSFGDIVGIKGGKISKNINGATQYMVITKNPGVLGNMPPKAQEINYEKVAFMGQVLTKVNGSVKVGDFIIATLLNDGIGKAVHPREMTPGQYKRIVGTAWSGSSGGLSMINTAVGVNTGYAASELEKLKKENQQLKQNIHTIAGYLKSKDPDFDAESMIAEPYSFHTEKETVDIELAKNPYEKIFTALEKQPELLINIQRNARALLKERKIDYNKFEQTQRLVNDPEYYLTTLKKLSIP